MPVPPERVVVRFASGVTSRTTRIALVAPKGSSSLTIEGGGDRPMEELSIPVPNHGKGRYVVRWELTDREGKHLGGRIRFDVSD